PQLDRVSPNPETYTPEEEFITMDYSGSGDVTANLIATTDIVIPPGSSANTSSSGCEDSDFPAGTAGKIALIQRGTCTFFDTALNAQEAGAVGAIIFNEGQPGRDETLAGTLGETEDITIPVTGTSFAIGQELFNLLKIGQVQMHMFISTLIDPRSSSNVLAEWPAGRRDRVVVAGAHLDSVTEGPGINDNGSGSAVLLEIAEEISELDLEPRNRIRFAFWGAEEAGLVGSEHYVASLPRRQLNDIELYLNFDMVGSPNFVRFVYDGSGDIGPKGPSGSKRIEDVFLTYFRNRDLPTEPTEFDGRSDYDPFIMVGIPAGGLFTGAEGIKTPEQARIYGGTAGIAYDPCYHQACDTIDNVSETAINQMSDATAHAILVFAMTTSSTNGTDQAADEAVANAADEAFLFKGHRL
ncbi:MAG: M20/M25/M40 family metallo-hydrolase, partial [Actinomycetota bacterium]